LGRTSEGPLGIDHPVDPASALQQAIKRLSPCQVFYLPIWRYFGAERPTAAKLISHKRISGFIDLFHGESCCALNRQSF
jgi:hypothetical protein